MLRWSVCPLVVLILGQVNAQEPLSLPNMPSTFLPRPPDSEVLPLPLPDLKSLVQKLQGERTALTEDQARFLQNFAAPTSPESEANLKLRLRLEGLLNQMSTRLSPNLLPKPVTAPKETDPKKNTTPSAAPSSNPDGKPTHLPSPETIPTEFSKSLDPLALAHALFRIQNYAGSLQAFRLIPLTGMKVEERAPIQYLMATCLRKMGKVEEASSLYREVANYRGDEHLAALAQWQLVTIRWHKEMNDRLQDIRRRRAALENMP